MSDFGKPWYTSRGVWGGVISLLSLFLGIWGYSISPEETEQLVLALTGVGAAIGNIVGVYGRLKAKERLR